MLKTNFIEVISTFSKDEFKEFVDFARSPVHNSSKSLIKLIDVSRKYYPEFDNRNFTKEKVYTKVFSSENYNDQVMRNLMSDALQLAYSFLSFRGLKTDSFQSSTYLLNQLRNRKLESLYHKTFRQVQKSVNEENSVGFRYFDFLYRLEADTFVERLAHNRQEELYPVIVRLSEFLTFDYITRLTNHLIDMEVNEKYFSVDKKDVYAKDIFSGLDIEKVLASAKNISEKDYSILSLFYYRALSRLRGDNESYLKFRKLFFEISHLFERDTNYNLITSLETFCIDNIKYDPVKYRNELHEIHLKAIDLNVVKMHPDDYLSLLRFWNIFINSVEISKVDWAEKFTHKYQNDLEPAVREGASNFANAIISYKRLEYDKALELLNKTKFSQYLFRLSIKTFYLRIYFDKGDTESASFALDSYKQFLYKNKKISENYRESYLNFAAVYQDLLKFKSGMKDIDPFGIKQKLDTIPNIYNKLWLVEKLDEIGK